MKILPFKLTVVAIVFTFNHTLNAQLPPPPEKKINFLYSQNPKTKKNAPQKTVSITEDPVEQPGELITSEKVELASKIDSRSAASITHEITKKAVSAAVSPTEIYKVGINDILFISLLNAPSKASNYFTVLNNGTIDYPLAGEMVPVQGLTIEEIENLLTEKIKLYESPQVSVKIREHASHSVTVLGLVEKNGEKYLQREAVPLFVIRAEAIVRPQAKFAVIKRENAETEKIALNDSKSDDVLIFPGDIIEFKDDAPEIAEVKEPQFYYIGGAVNAGGQKEFHEGITLTQAILASGGLKRSTIKTVTLRRKNNDGLLSPLEFDLNSIKAGKQPDPVLFAGDTIEVDN